MITFDEALTKVGGQNMFQYRLFSYFSLYWALFCIFLQSGTFWLAPPDFICSDGQYCTENNGGCDEKVIDMNGYETITSQFELYCDKQSLRNLAQSIIFIGGGLGSIIISLFIDVKGRRFGLYVTNIICLISLIGIILANSAEIYIASSFFLGFGTNPQETLIFSIFGEQSNGIFRQIGSIGFGVFWSLGQIVVSICAYYIQNWQSAFLWCVLIPYSFLVIISTIFTIESPSWLMNYNQKKAVQLLNHIARVNKQPLLSLNTQIQCEQYPGDKQEIMKQFKLIFYDKGLRTITISASISIGFLYMIYFGSQFSLNQLSSNVYLNVIIVGCAEMFTNVIAAIFIDKIPRRKGAIYGSFISVAVCFSFLLFDFKNKCQNCYQYYITIIFSCNIRFFNLFTMSIVNIYMVEVFPTQVRSIGQGISYSFGVLITFLAPYINQFAIDISIYPVVLLGSFGLLSGLSSFYFEETQGQPVKQEIQNCQKEKLLCDKKLNVENQIGESNHSSFPE